MAFMVLALSCLPCADDAFSMSIGEAKTELVKRATQENDQDHNDTCSPFCQCACCAGFSLGHGVTSISTPFFYGDKSYIFYLPENLLEISAPIWQPPKLL